MQIFQSKFCIFYFTTFRIDFFLYQLNIQFSRDLNSPFHLFSCLCICGTFGITHVEPLFTCMKPLLNVEPRVSGIKVHISPKKLPGEQLQETRKLVPTDKKAGSGENRSRNPLATVATDWKSGMIKTGRLSSTASLCINCNRLLHLKVYNLQFTLYTLYTGYKTALLRTALYTTVSQN